MTTKTKPTSHEFMKHVRSGAYQNQYLIYCRKSTDEAENQKNSIVYQAKENASFAKREGFSVASVSIEGFCADGVITEKHSGFKEDDALAISDDGTVQYKIDRPKFQKLLKLLSEERFAGVICLCWDRISRNRGDDTIIRKLMRKGVDIQFVYAKYDQSSAGELHMDIDGMFAQHHSRVTSEKIKLTTRTKRGEGKCTYRAPIGYLNTGTIDHKPFDPERAPIIKEMFELYATGTWSLSDLTRHAEKQGLTTVPSRTPRTRAEILSDECGNISERPKVSRPLGKNRISSILRNRFYIGQIIGPDGLYIPSTSHEPLVDTMTFDAVQVHLSGKRVSQHHPEKIDYPFRGFVRCAKCERVYTPYRKKGILYLAVNCVPGCGNTRRNINAGFIDSVLINTMRDITLSEDELAKFDARADTEIGLLIEKERKRSLSREREKKRIDDDLAYLRANQLTLLRAGTYTPDSLLKERQKLEADLDAVSQSEAVSEASMRDLVKDVLKISELLNNLTELYELANGHEKARIVEILCSELLVDENMANLKPQIAMKPLFEAKVLFCAESSSFSEFLLSLWEIKIALKKIQDLLMQ